MGSKFFPIASKSLVLQLASTISASKRVSPFSIIASRSFKARPEIKSNDTDSGSPQRATQSQKPESKIGKSPYPAFSFQGLSTNSTVKIVVIAALSVFGTIESIFWAKVLWAWVSPPKIEKENEA